MDWTTKYRPGTLEKVRGNRDALDKLKKWAMNWDDHQEAVILHGRAGVGKTTAAHALANDAGWESIEMNASESRTEDVVERIAGNAASTGTLYAGVDGQRLVILDEADSLHGNIDRGGTAAMRDVVKEASQPVILIANEFYDMSRSLRNACQAIEFDLLSDREIKRFLRDICQDEDIEYTDEALKAIAANADGDVRGAINDLQAVATRVSDELTVEDLPTGSRDRTEDMFPFLDSVFKDASPQEAREAAFTVDETPDDVVPWIEDNVVKVFNAAELHQAYEFLARADEWLGRVRATQNYSYWKYVSDQAAAGVAASRQGSHSGWTRYGPPSYWQKLGRSRGTRNKRNAITTRIAEVSGVSIATARQDILPFLSIITHHCKNRDATVAATAVYELDASEVSFVTGSGEDTNKVQSIVEDAKELREEQAFEATGGNFGSTEKLDGASGGNNEPEEPTGGGEGEAPQERLDAIGQDDEPDETLEDGDESKNGDDDPQQTTLF